MVTIFARGHALQGQTSTEVVTFLAALVGRVPAVCVVFESGRGVEGALLAMKLRSPAQLLDEIANRAAGVPAGKGTLVTLGSAFGLDQFASEKWPEDLHPIGNQTGEQVLRFRIGRHQSATAKTSS